ncbi:MAG: hypothetical protein ABIK89_12460, partial [Planctomycetota bacterium]
QVLAKVNEAKITLVKPGLFASIRLDAFADLGLEGEVERVSKYPAPSSWFMSNVKEYEAFIRIKNGEHGQKDDKDIEGDEGNGGRQSSKGDEGSEGDEDKEDTVGSDDDDETLAELRPGMTAEVKIRVEETPNVLQVPVQAMIEHGSKHFCVVPRGDGYLAREVKIGSTNDKVVVILKGLDEGEDVVLNAAAYRRDIDLPDVPTESPVAQARSAGSPAATGKEGGSSSQAAGAAEPAAADRVDQMLSRLDANGNGQLEMSEVPERMQSVIAGADSDGDKVISRKELAAAVARMPAGGPGGRRQGPGGAGGPGAGGPGGRGPEAGGPGAGGRPGGGPGGNRPARAGSPGGRP